jgi:hypothetical protein
MAGCDTVALPSYWERWNILSFVKTYSITGYIVLQVVASSPARDFAPCSSISMFVYCRSDLKFRWTSCIHEWITLKPVEAKYSISNVRNLSSMINFYHHKNLRVIVLVNNTTATATATATATTNSTVIVATNGQTCPISLFDLIFLKKEGQLS